MQSGCEIAILIISFDVYIHLREPEPTEKRDKSLGSFFLWTFFHGVWVAEGVEWGGRCWHSSLSSAFDLLFINGDSG